MAITRLTYELGRLKTFRWENTFKTHESADNETIALMKLLGRKYFRNVQISPRSTLVSTFTQYEIESQHSRNETMPSIWFVSSQVIAISCTISSSVHLSGTKENHCIFVLTRNFSHCARHSIVVCCTLGAKRKTPKWFPCKFTWLTSQITRSNYTRSIVLAQVTSLVPRVVSAA